MKRRSNAVSRIRKYQDGTDLVPDLQTLGVNNSRKNLMLQQGSSDKEPIGSKTAAGIYDAGPPKTTYQGKDLEERDAAQQELDASMDQLRKSVYGTVGVQINGQEMEVPLWNKGMTPAQAEDAARMRLEWGLHPFASDADLEAKQNAAGQGPDNASNLQNPSGYKKGTSNVKKYAKGTDSVPAMLTPKEAILNRNAAELLGRDAIKRLNAHGNMLAKRGVDLASLASDPTPGPSTENMLGYETGTADVRKDDRGDLLRDADATFYGGGHVPAPSPTPKPVRGYAYGTDDVLDQNDYPNAASRVRPRTVTSTMASSFYSGRGGTPLGPQYDPSTGFPNPHPSGTVGLRGAGDTNISGSTYIGRNGVDLGPQYGNQGQLNPKPAGAIGLQGSLPQTTAQRALSNFNRPMTHTEMAADIAKRNLTASGSQLGNPQPQSGIPGIDASTLADQGIDPSQSMANVNFTALRNIQDNKDRQAGTFQPPAINQSTVHFLPPGFTTTTGSTGAPNSSPNDINFLPPGFTSVQGAVNATTKQLQEPDQGYGSAYGY